VKLFAVRLGSLLRKGHIRYNHRFERGFVCRPTRECFTMTASMEIEGVSSGMMRGCSPTRSGNHSCRFWLAGTGKVIPALTFSCRIF
jgi:hypothetical protein